MEMVSKMYHLRAYIILLTPFYFVVGDKLKVVIAGGKGGVGRFKPSMVFSLVFLMSNLLIRKNHNVKCDSSSNGRGRP